jgi:hypothetical protein
MIYYCEKYSTTEDTVSDFDTYGTSSTKIVKEFFFCDLSGNLAYIKSNFGGISTMISCLEAVGLEMHDALVLVKGTECEVEHARGEVGDSMKSKLQNVLGRNNGHATVCKISDILSGKGVSLEKT